MRAVSNPKAQRKPLNPTIRGTAPWQRCLACMGCFTHIHRRALDKACHQHISSSCILLVRTGPLPQHAARLGMETLTLSGKWAEVGGAALDVMGSPLLLAYLQESFYRKGLNRHLPRQTKPALALALWNAEKAGRGRGNSLSIGKIWLQQSPHFSARR